MVVETKKKASVVTVELCDQKLEYTGRLLGLVNDSEFYRIVSSKRTQNKLFSSCRVIGLSPVPLIAHT